MKAEEEKERERKRETYFPCIISEKIVEFSV
jgi:hypothetical protein